MEDNQEIQNQEPVEAQLQEQPVEAAENQPQAESTGEADIETLLREAEQRGYLRGRNELIENLRDIPQAWPAPDDPSSCHLEFMNRPRTSIWQ